MQIQEIDQSQCVLTPVQQPAKSQLIEAAAHCDVVVLKGFSGCGKTTILEHVRHDLGGALIGAGQFMDAIRNRNPLAIEETFVEIAAAALRNHELVLIDDLHLIVNIVESCDYPRANLLDLAFTAILAAARAAGRKLIFAVNCDTPWPVRRRAHIVEVRNFTTDDYAALCRAYLAPATAGRLDFRKIHRFAPKLNAHQLRNAAVWLQGNPDLDTEAFLAHLTAQNLTSNVEIQEVEPVQWSDLKGMEDVVEALEAKIALPLENDALAAELNLKPKRGVLLAGPPGTGKTTIGRALAHRLKSKFFLLDGTVIADSGDFYSEVSRIFEAARNNAPAIIFIDDADVLFESERKGFYRYLLTMLDGLESASAERICVVMTTMDISSLPPAVLRSGRVELWLETRLPDAEARAVIVREKLAALPEPIRQADVEVIAEAAAGLTGADLKSMIEDGKLLYARDKACGRSLRPAEEYFLEAIRGIRENRRSYRRRKPSPFAGVQIGFKVQ